MFNLARSETRSCQIFIFQSFYIEIILIEIELLKVLFTLFFTTEKRRESEHEFLQDNESR